MNLFLEKGTLHFELTEALAQFEKQAATLGMHPDELVDQFHHNSMAFLAEEKKHRMQICNSRKTLFAAGEISEEPCFLSVIR